MSHGQINPALLQPGLAPVRTTTDRNQVGQVSRPGAGGPQFADHLAKAAPAVRFSNHALQRIERRGIDMSPEVTARLDAGVMRAAQKGAREALVLVDGTAFVVGVQARTVVTAVDPASMREHVFTNIDSAVIA